MGDPRSTCVGSRAIADVATEFVGVIQRKPDVQQELEPGMKLQSARLGVEVIRSRQWSGVLIVAFGLWTLFLPMLAVNPPVADQRQWTLIQITRAILARTLPAPGGQIDWGPGGLLDILLLYVLMVLCGVALWFESWRVLRVLTVLGLYLSYEAKWWDSAFHRLFGYYGHLSQWQMDRAAAWWILPWVLPSMAVIAFSEIGTKRRRVRQPRART